MYIKHNFLYIQEAQRIQSEIRNVYEPFTAMATTLKKDIFDAPVDQSDIELVALSTPTIEMLSQLSS